MKKHACYATVGEIEITLRCVCGEGIGPGAQTVTLDGRKAKLTRIRVDWNLTDRIQRAITKVLRGEKYYYGRLCHCDADPCECDGTDATP